MHHLYTFHLLKTEGVNQTKGERQHILTLISRKKFIKYWKAVDFPLTSIIYLQQIYILRMWQKCVCVWRGGGGEGLYFSPISQYHNTGVWTFLKPMLMIEHMKMMQMPCLDISSICFFLGKCLVRPIQVNCFGMSYSRKKKQVEKGEWLMTYFHIFMKKNPGIFFVFLCTPGNSRQTLSYKIEWK